MNTPISNPIKSTVVFIHISSLPKHEIASFQQ